MKRWMRKGWLFDEKKICIDGWNHSSIGITVGMMSTAYALSEEQKIDIYTDEETKIQYIIVRFTSTAGAGVGICPRYTSSGNLYYVGSKKVDLD